MYDPTEYQPLPAEEVFEQTLEEEGSEEERRLEVASYYKAIIKGGFFPDNPTQGAQIVEAEMRAYARNRLQVLLGMRPEVEQPAVFTEQEIKILKKLAEAGLRKYTEAKPEVTPLTVAPPQVSTPVAPQITPISHFAPAQRSQSVAKPTKTPKTSPKPQKRVANTQKRAKISGQVIPPGILPMPNGASAAAVMTQAAAEQLELSNNTVNTLLKKG